MAAIKVIETLKYFLDRLPWPIDFFESPDFFNQIYVCDYYSHFEEEGVFSKFQIAFEDEISFKVANLEEISFVFGSTIPGITVLNFRLLLARNGYLELQDIPVCLRFSDSILKPVDDAGAIIPNAYSQIVSTGSITVDSRFNLDISGFDSLNLNPSMIGNTGIIISTNNLKFDFLRTTSIPEVVGAGFDESFMGVYIEEANIQFNSDFGTAFPSDLYFQKCIIGTGGFSGRVEADWQPQLSSDQKSFTGNGSGELFGIPFALKQIAIEFKQTTLVESLIEGAMILPFFDQPIVCSINLTNDGDFTVAIAADQSLPGLENIPQENGLFIFTKENLIQLKLRSIAFEKKDNLLEIILGGGIRPLFGGINWPEFEINPLRIDSKGKVKIDGGWLNLPTNGTADFHGFALEVSQLGFGNEADGSKWLGFSGGLMIVDGVSIRGAVEGLKIIWTRDNRIRLEIKGVQVAFFIEDVLYFDGQIVFIDEPDKKGFKGGVNLILYALEGASIDAQFIAGKNSLTPPYNFFYIFLGFDLPVGLPLGSTGLALYGLAGLFGYNMSVNKGLAPHPVNEAWFENPDGSPGFYKRGKPGITSDDKWANIRDAMAFGAGFTFGTFDDNGFKVSAKALLVVLIPGPVVLLEGKVGIVQERAKLTDDSILRMLAVLDFRTGTYLLNIEMRWKLPNSGKILDIIGGAEAFFSSNNPNAWYFYLGRKDPVSRRIRAKILSLFDANNYFMLDHRRLEVGTWMGFDKRYKFGPARINIAFWVEGIFNMNFKPIQAWGSLALNGEIDAKIFGVGVKLLMYSSIYGKVPSPFLFRGVLIVKIDMPWPLDPIEGKAVLEWKEEGRPPIPIPLAGIGIEHLKATEKWELTKYPVYDTDGDGFDNGTQIPEPATAYENVPLVPMDARPVIIFNKPVSDVASIGNTISPSDPPAEQVDDYQFKYILKSVTLEKKPVNGTGAWLIAAGKGVDNIPDDQIIMGEWQVIPEEESKNVKLMLWANNPFTISRELDSNHSWLIATMNAKALAQPGTLGYRYPCYLDENPVKQCINFEEQVLGDSSLPVLQIEEVIIYSPLFPLYIVECKSPEIKTEKALTLWNAKVITKNINISDLFIDEASGTTIGDGISISVARDGFIKQGSIQVVEENIEGNIKKVLKFENKGNETISMDIDPVQLISGASMVEFYCQSDSALEIKAFTEKNEEDTKVYDLNRGGWQKLIFEQEGIRRLNFNGNTFKLSEIKYKLSESKECLFIFPQDVAMVELYFCEGTDLTWTTFDRDMNLIDSDRFKAAENVNKLLKIEDEQKVIRGIKLSGDFKLIQVCYIDAEEQKRVDRNITIYEHNKESAEERWTNEAPLLDPQHYYRIKVVTETKWRKQSGNWHTKTFEEHAYFRTGSPPGVTELAGNSWFGVEREYAEIRRNRSLLDQSRVANLNLNSNLEISASNSNSSTASINTASPEDPNPDRYPFGGPLKDLGPYIRQTVPQQFASNEPQRPYYRSYDIGILFNEPQGYVEQMYLMAGYNLEIRLFDVNDDPALDMTGRPIVLENKWSKQSEKVFTREEDQWIGYLEENCRFNIDRNSDKIEERAVLYTGHKELNLNPKTVYKARVYAGPFKVYEWIFKSSAYSNFVHQIHSFDDILWDWSTLHQGRLIHDAEKADLSGLLDSSGLSYKNKYTPNDYQPEKENVLFEQINELFFKGSIRYLPERLEVMLLKDSENMYGFLLESDEPLDWERITFSIQHKNSSSEISEFPDSSVKLIDVSFGNSSNSDVNDEYVTLLLMDDFNPSGLEIRYQLPSGSETDSYFTFGNERKMPSGTIIYVHSGKTPSPDDVPKSGEHRYLLPSDSAENGTRHFNTTQQTIELWNSDNLLHSKTYMPYSSEPKKMIKLIRNQDQTRAFIFFQGAINEGRYRFNFEFDRKGETVNNTVSQQTNVAAIANYPQGGQHDILSKRVAERASINISNVNANWGFPELKRLDKSDMEETYIEFIT